MERTLVIVKPDAVSKGQIGEIVERFEIQGLRVCGLKMICLSKEKAEGFYQVHRGRPFFESLTTFMSSGPSVAMVLEGEGAIAAVRKLIGATNPQEAEEGTIRRDLAMSIEQNVVHGSDSAQSASFEIPYFFSALELFSHQREA
jgi:nucleoside-diphosphate kinase